MGPTKVDPCGVQERVSKANKESMNKSRLTAHGSRYRMGILTGGQLAGIAARVPDEAKPLFR